MWITQIDTWLYLSIIWCIQRLSIFLFALFFDHNFFTYSPQILMWKQHRSTTEIQRKPPKTQPMHHRKTSGKSPEKISFVTSFNSLNVYLGDIDRCWRVNFIQVFFYFSYAFILFFFCRTDTHILAPSLSVSSIPLFVLILLPWFSLSCSFPFHSVLFFFLFRFYRKLSFTFLLLIRLLFWSLFLALFFLPLLVQSVFFAPVFIFSLFAWRQKKEQAIERKWMKKKN